MAKLPSENTDTVKYFREYLNSWLSKSGINETSAAKRFGIAQSLLNEFLNHKKGMSICNLEKICRNHRINIVDALEIGRKKSEKKTTISPEDGTKNKILVLSRKISNENEELVEAFKMVMSHGGELAEELAERVKAIAKKRREEAENKNPTMTNLESA